MKKFWIKKGLMIVIFGAAAILAFGFLVMSLWNFVLPAVLGVKTISFIQALAILLLSKILFGGFGSRGSRWRGRAAWKDKIKQRWDTMSPEEREKFKAEWKHKCGNRWSAAAKTPDEPTDSISG